MFTLSTQTLALWLAVGHASHLGLHFAAALALSSGTVGQLRRHQVKAAAASRRHRGGVE